MVETVKKSSFHYKTDLSKKASRQDHPSGILHAFRSAASFLAPKEEQCFAWIANPHGRYYDDTDPTKNTDGDDDDVNDDNENDDNINRNDCNKVEIEDHCKNGKYDDDEIGEHMDDDGDDRGDEGNANTNNYATEDETNFENVEPNTHLHATLAHLERFGFLAKNVKFIPFSSKANWIYRYPVSGFVGGVSFALDATRRILCVSCLTACPDLSRRWQHAYPYIECNEVGEVSGFPYWNPSTGTDLSNPIGGSFHPSLGMGRDACQDNPTKYFLGRSVEATAANTGNDGIRTDIAAAATATAVAAAASTAIAASAPTSEKRGKSILRAAMLSDKEREQLHLEIYDYFQWLESELTQLETTHDGRRTTSNAGLVVSGLRNVIARMEGTFRVVRERDDAEKEASATGSGAPFLEEVLGSALRQRYRRLQPMKKAGHSRVALDFEDMYARLLAFRQGGSRIDECHPCFFFSMLE